MEDKTINRPEKAFLSGQHVEQTYGGCGQCVLYSLIENGFDISKDVFRSASGLAAGVGRQGETCGAVTGDQRAERTGIRRDRRDGCPQQDVRAVLPVHR